MATRRAASPRDPAPEPGAPPVRRRLAPEDREQQIVEAAIGFFSRHGFEASTRDLAR